MRIPPPPPAPELENVDVLPKVLLHTSALGAMVWRQNSGLYYARTATGWRRVRAAIPGCSDILGLISLSVPRLYDLGIPRIGAFLSIEAKTQAGRPEPSQLEFRSGVEQRDGLYLIARRPEDVDRGLRGLLG